MRTSDKRPALLLLAAAAVLVGVAFLIPDERMRVLLVLLAVPMGVGGAVTIAWGNARGELERLRGRGD